MTKTGSFTLLAAAALLATGTALAQGQFTSLKGDALAAATPQTVQLEGKDLKITTRNATAVVSPSGGRAFLAIQDGTGYGSEVASQKYTGVIQVQAGKLEVAGTSLSKGNYGFGWKVPAKGAEGPGEFVLFNQAGAKIGGCETTRDGELKVVKPLQVVPAPDGSAKFYYGRHSVELR